jgi:hypothetical protein
MGCLVFSCADQDKKEVNAMKTSIGRQLVRWCSNLKFTEVLCLLLAGFMAMYMWSGAMEVAQLRAQQAPVAEPIEGEEPAPVAEPPPVIPPPGDMTLSIPTKHGLLHIKVFVPPGQHAAGVEPIVHGSEITGVTLRARGEEYTVLTEPNKKLVFGLPMGWLTAQGNFVILSNGDAPLFDVTLADTGERPAPPPAARAYLQESPPKPHQPLLARPATAQPPLEPHTPQPTTDDRIRDILGRPE